MTQPDPLLTHENIAASYSGDDSITPGVVREWFNHRYFPLVKIGRRLYVRQSVFEAFLSSSTIPARESK